MTNNQDSKNNNQPTNEEPQINDLRSKVKKTLKSFVNNKEASNKEMEIFDKTVSRRSFLGGTFKLSAVAALVGQGLVPSAFAARNPEFALPSDEMPILTAELKAEITTAAKIQVSSDVVDGVLKHRHIEHVSEKYLEDILESLNPLVRAQEDFQSPEQGLSHLENALQRTYGHPELVRLQNCSNNSINGKELVIYEYKTNQTAPLKPRVIQLPTNYPEEFIIEAKNGKNWELQKGSEIQSKYFKLVFQDDSNVVLYAKDKEGVGSVAFSAGTNSLSNAGILVLQTDGRLAIYDKDGNFLKDLADLGDYSVEEGKKTSNPRLKITTDGKIILESKQGGNEWIAYKTLGGGYGIDRSKFDNVNDKDFEYNRVVSVNGPKHNTINNNKVKNQKMILVAKQSVQGSWDGSPAKWIEHVNEMDSCYHQAVLFVQNTRHDIHQPDDTSKLKAGIYDEGKISDTSGQTWRMFNPLALLEQKLNEFNFDVRVPRHQEEARNNARARITLEDIGKFSSGDDFACLYGTIKVNLWCNLGFYIHFHESQDDPVVKIFAIDQASRKAIAYDSDTTYHNGGSGMNSHNIWSKIHYNKDFKLNENDLINGKLKDFKNGNYYHENARRLSHILLRQKNGEKSFIEQLFKPVGFIDDERREGDKKVLFAYEHTQIHDIGDYKSEIKRSAAFEFLPYNSNNGIFQIQHKGYDYHINKGGLFITYSHEEIRNLRKIYKSTNNFYNLIADNMHEVIFGDINGKYKGVFQYYKRYGSNNSYTLYHSRAYEWGTSNATFMQANITFNQGSALIQEEIGKMVTFDKFKSCFGGGTLSLSKILEHKEDVEKASLDFSLTGAARLSFLMTDGRLYIINQIIDKQQGNYAPPVFENGFTKWNPVYTQISSSAQSNTSYVKTLRLLDWKKFSNDHEMVCVQEIKDDKTQSTQYSYITKEIVDQTWHSDRIDAQLAMGEDVITDHIEQATIYDVELQALNCYEKHVALEDNQCFEIRFAQPVYTENFTQGDQRGVGTYAKRMESIFIKPDTSGRALVQVRVPRVDQLSGITFSYRILDNHKFESAVNSPLLRIKNNVDDIYAWHQMNLAYNIHARMDEQTHQEGSNLLNSVFNNLDSEYKDNNDIKNKLREGLQKSSSSLRQASFGENEEETQMFQSNRTSKPIKTRMKRRVDEQPNILHRNQPNVVLYQSHSNDAAINPMFNPTSQIASGMLGGWLSDIWHDVCDFAISVLNKIKEAINWIKDKLNDILSAIEDLGIPGISDIAKIAKSVVTLVAGVLTAIVDVAIMIVNILKYIFDFAEAKAIGERMVTLFHRLMKYSTPQFKVSNNLKLLYDTNNDASTAFENINNLVQNNSTEISNNVGIFGEGFDSVVNELNSIKDMFDNVVIDGINYVINFLVKNLFGNSDSNDNGSDFDWYHSENKDRSSRVFETIEKITQPSIFPGGQILNFYNLFDSLKNMDLNDPLKLITSEFGTFFQTAGDEVIGFLQDPMDHILAGMAKIQIPSFISGIANFIFGVELENFRDILYLVIGYPVMMCSNIILGIANLIPGVSVSTNIKETINNAISVFESPKSTYMLTAEEKRWKKDALFEFQCSWTLLSFPIVSISSTIQTLMKNEKPDEHKYNTYEELEQIAEIESTVKTFSLATTIFSEIGGLINEVPAMSRDMNKVIGWIGLEMLNPDDAFSKSISNGFPQLSPKKSDSSQETLYKILEIKSYAGMLVRLIVRLSKMIEFINYMYVKQAKGPRDGAKLAKVAKYTGKAKDYINAISSVLNIVLDILVACYVKNEGKQVQQLNMSIAADIIGDLRGCIDAVQLCFKKPDPYVTLASMSVGLGGAVLAGVRRGTDENS